eukprot:Gregarina_sp_Poly_1__8794@NODE_527_length_7671_cov_210_928196_g177_i1_p5_GENE_NODE_527_length_7671_cov_210_928196_g177_i1NODE_527_length_7671_cov_210_928196_g177_i1_p5_ORF_typecomplete_len353_score50_17SLBP_RNA_bind/PF15247_6/9_3e12_NODE_527_length_7671_cov_210_928196_g177_i14321490
MPADLSQTQPPPVVGPPPGLEDDTEPDAIDALVDTLSRVLTRSLCQTQPQAADFWESKQVSVHETEVGADEHLTTQCPPSLPETQHPTQNLPGCASEVELPMSHLGTLPGFGDSQNTGDGPCYSGFQRLISLPERLASPGWVPGHCMLGYDDQFFVGGFPVTEWRRFFVYLATMDSGMLVSYLNAHGLVWQLSAGTDLSILHHQPSMSPMPCVSPTRMPGMPPSYLPPVPLTQHPCASPTVSLPGPSRASLERMITPPPPPPQIRRRTLSRPWRRQDIPPPSEGRFKQIARAKATPEYLLYIERVKREERNAAAGDPVTPRVEGTTWREFQQDVRAWKRSLHRKAEALQRPS